jgi:hypothetical protein
MVRLQTDAMQPTPAKVFQHLLLMPGKCSGPAAKLKAATPRAAPCRLFLGDPGLGLVRLSDKSELARNSGQRRQSPTRRN